MTAQVTIFNSNQINCNLNFQKLKMKGWWHKLPFL